MTNLLKALLVIGTMLVLGIALAETLIVAMGG